MKACEVSRIRVGLGAIVLLLSCAAADALAGWSVDIESGLAVSGYNDVRIPGSTGTDISLSEDLDANSTGFIRARITGSIGQRHSLSLLIAPLRFTASGAVDREVHFNGVLFAAHEPLSSKYRFDSYRLTYRYTLYGSGRIRAGVGFTAKVRDASIQIDGGGESSEKSNTGFVPLVNFALDWRFASGLGVVFEGDALAAPQGRAEDVLIAVYSDPVDKLRLRFGYRILEGGADNDNVYTFALVHYVSAGMIWSF